MNKPEDIKRKRSENWNEEDKELIRKRVKTIENKNTDTNTNHSKKKAWIEVAENFNILCVGGQRTITQLKNQWVATKIAAKKQVSERRKEILKTGGGSLPTEEPVSSEDITVWLPNEFVVDSNEFDSGAALKEIGQDTQITKENNDESLCETEKIEFPEKIQENVATPFIKKKSATKTTQEYHIKHMVEFDIKCREELHKNQLEVVNAKLGVEKAKLEVEKARLEVEKAKLRNLNLEHQLIKERNYSYNKYSVGTYACIKKKEKSKQKKKVNQFVLHIEGLYSKPSILKKESFEESIKTGYILIC